MGRVQHKKKAFMANICDWRLYEVTTNYKQYEYLYQCFDKMYYHNHDLRTDNTEITGKHVINLNMCGIHIRAIVSMH